MALDNFDDHGASDAAPTFDEWTMHDLGYTRAVLRRLIDEVPEVAASHLGQAAKDAAARIERIIDAQNDT